MMSSSSSPKPSTEPLSLLSLPSDVQEEILYRTPAEDLLRSKSICKKWNALINDLIPKEKFIQKHLDHSSSSSSAQRFIRTVDTVRILDPVRQRRLTSPLPEELQERIDVLLQCDGLVLCRRGDSSIKGKEQVAIWNPMFKGVRWIKGCLGFKTLLGIGYKNRREGYMILSVPDRRFRLVTRNQPVRIYDLKNASWRNLDNVNVDWVLDSSSQGVAATGNMYWVVQNKNLESCIEGFDFTLEAFKTVCLCPPHCGGNRFLSCSSKDQLCLLHQELNSGMIEVWVSNKLSDETVSFAMHFSVPNPALRSLKPGVTNSDPVFYFVEPKKIAAWCVRTEGQLRTALYEVDEEAGVRDLTGSERYSETLLVPFFFGCVYLPSLVPIPESDVGWVTRSELADKRRKIKM